MTAILAIIMVWAGLIAWIAKVAHAHGRSVMFWVPLAIVAGGLGAMLGFELMSAVVDAEPSTGVLLLATLTPLLLMAAPMIGIAIALQRSPIYVAFDKDWPIHFVGRGSGRLRIHAGNVSFEWQDGSRAVAVRELKSVEADGECVRVRLPDDDELCLMPMGKPETPAGRRQQSLQLARRLR